MMKTKDLKEMGFEIQPEFKRAVFWLSDENKFAIIVESDKTVRLDMGGFSARIQSSSKMDDIKKLIELFNGSKLQYPF